MQLLPVESCPSCCQCQQVSLAPPYAVDDATFKKLVAILRIAVPYTGMILRWVLALAWGMVENGPATDKARPGSCV